MIGLTSSLVRTLDMTRKIGMGADAALTLLTHDPDRGYLSILDDVPGGWTVELGGIGQLQTLVIVEREGVDRETLLAVRAFSINNQVYELVSGYRIVAPEIGSPLPEWVYPVAPTGEKFIP